MLAVTTKKKEDSDGKTNYYNYSAAMDYSVVNGKVNSGKIGKSISYLPGRIINLSEVEINNIT